MNWRSWNRLGLFEAGPLDLAEDIRQTIDALVRDGHHKPEWDQQWRFRAANHLQRLLRCPAALEALTAPGKGRPRNHDAWDMALAYAARRVLLGRGKADAAAADIARAWSVQPGTVKDAYTKHRRSADSKLSALLSGYSGKSSGTVRQTDGTVAEEHWTRETLLEAIEADALDRHLTKTKNRRK